MKVIQSYNQNAVAVVNEHGRELVLVGKGIGFNKKKNDFIDISDADKVFKYYYSDLEQQIVDSLEDISPDIILMAEEIAEKAKSFFKDNLNPSFLFTLASHIQVAIERTKEEGNFPSPFTYELKYIYPREFEIAQWAVNYLYSEYNIELADAEISFFTLHFVNGLENVDKIEDVINLGNIINSITLSLEENIDFDITRDSLEFSRFVVHLRYFIFRQLNADRKEDRKITDFYKGIKDQFPVASKISQKIRHLLLEDFNIETNEEESFYLILHIERLLDGESSREDEGGK